MPRTLSGKTAGDQKKSPLHSGEALSAWDWLLHSGIQNQPSSPELDGGVNAWFDLRTDSYPFIYSEITGYAVNAFLFYYAQTHEPAALQAAQKAAQWLIRNRDHETGLIRTRLNHAHFESSYFDSWIFTFDQWIIVYSLSCLFEVTGNDLYLSAAISMADFLLDHTVNKDGSFAPVFNLKTKKIESTGDKWSRQPGSFHAKALMALAKLQQLTGKNSYGNSAQLLKQWTLSRQLPEGHFVTLDADGSTHLHPFLYTLEGLTSFGLSQNCKEAIEASYKGIQWILREALFDRGTHSFFVSGGFLPFIRVDIMAQTLRLASIFRIHGYLQDNAALLHIRSKLLAYQMTHGSQKGGFLYGQEENGTLHYHVNAWVTMFAAQALSIHDDYLNSKRLYDMSYFV